MPRIPLSRSAGTVALAAVFALVVALRTPAADPVDPTGKVPAKNIDVVLCLDVSNSMDGLISSAKMRLWDVVNDLAKIKPTPNLRVGLYSYGHNGYDPTKGWVRLESDLTTDLDLISKQLFGLTTRGGNEYVARVCRDALEQQKWASDKDSLKLIFVCGNEPASQDTMVTLEQVAKLGGDKGVIINPIFAGPGQSNDAKDWKQLAALAGGHFANIDQDRGTLSIDTPHDKELAELSLKLNGTYVGYGKDAQLRAMNQQAQDVNAGKVGQAAEATRAASKASALYRNSEWDIVDRMKVDAKFDITKVPEDQLPEELKKMKPEERLAYVKKKAAERDELQKQIIDLTKQREGYIREENKKKGDKSDKAFDEAIRAAIREQAARKGIIIPE
jgi:hypothetical protein